MEKRKPKLSTRPLMRDGEFAGHTNDQFAYPVSPPGDVPDGEHLSKIEKLFLMTLGRWCHHGKPCELQDIEIADAMGLPGTAQAMRSSIKAVINGRWSRGVRRPGLCDPSRGFIVRTYAKQGRNARQLYTTEKWERFSRAMHRLVAGPTDDDAPAAEAELPAEVAEAAAIAEAYMTPDVAPKIREAAHRFRRLKDLPGAVWVAAGRGKGFGYIVACDENGITPAEAEEARAEVINRAEAAGKAAAAEQAKELARREAARLRDAPPAPLTEEEIRGFRELAATPGNAPGAAAMRSMAAKTLADHGIPF